MVFPAEVAMELFPLLCQGEAVSYDWQDKTYKWQKPVRDYSCTVKQFTIAEYAQLALNEETK
jgi:hypothetical protein